MQTKATCVYFWFNIGQLKFVSQWRLITPGSGSQWLVEELQHSLPLELHRICKRDEPTDVGAIGSVDGAVSTLEERKLS